MFELYLEIRVSYLEIAALPPPFLLDRRLSCRLLRILLRAAIAGSGEFGADVNAHFKAFVVIGPGLIEHDIIGRDPRALLCFFLKTAFCVLPKPFANDLFEPIEKTFVDKFLRRIITLIEKDRPNHRLERIRENILTRASGVLRLSF